MRIRFPMLAFLLAAFAVPGTMAVERGRSAGPRTVGPIIAAFRKLDRDGNGQLSFNEWHRIGGGAEGMPSKALGLFRTSDLNRNQRLSPYEFARSQGFRISLPNSQSRPGGRGEGSQGATFITGSQGITIATVSQSATFTTVSGGGSNTTSGLPGGSSLTKVLGSTGGTLVISGAGGGNSVTNSVVGTVSNLGSVTNLGAGAVSLSSYTNTLALGSGNLTIGTLNPLALLTAPGTTDSSGNTILNVGPLSLSGGGRLQLGMLPVGTIQGGTLVISGTFSRYVGLTLEAATALADGESRASRVFSIDGVSQKVTTDWSPTRVNFFLVDGIVKLAIGG